MHTCIVIIEKVHKCNNNNYVEHVQTEEHLLNMHTKSNCVHSTKRSLVFIHTIATTSYHSVVFYNDIEENGEYKHV